MSDVELNGYLPLELVYLAGCQCVGDFDMSRAVELVGTVVVEYEVVHSAHLRERHHALPDLAGGVHADALSEQVGDSRR